MLANLLVIRSSFKQIRLGVELSHKPDKTEEEQQIVRSFKLTMSSTIAVVLAVFIVLTVIIFSTIMYTSGTSSATRTGTVEGTKVRYVQGTMKYVSLDELNISETSIKSGDKVKLYFDNYDKLINGKTEVDIDNSLKRMMLIIGGSIVFLIIFRIVMQLTYGRPWFNWLMQMSKLGRC
jgi:ABC-type transport system involved in cytochrome bd biosynthesis fused ATPase/permease subunit